ncbi:TPA: hypothetical protein JF904_000564 [Legionella pneumophila]|uniref:hypothetical protein n=1 Tax=Legionella pneumophila TaxID=446 RepID=UPI0005C42F73|nr:hypothetical protein [Legionella pneumophila]HAT9524519.1 hypothetical protein [Legionella pneumophila subsp. pneumophila]CZG23927.1 Uncharacterised protein [Legionella pneumophila]GAN29544.1 hypothetical protein lpymt_01136 [Legionella pneumophila]HAT1881265.1 hypothetical protein [Legionella pneumophila]HAT1980367.1 hypothetical protein [Legionella pneumophila]
MNTRNEFLINMYNQMFNDINRHITLTWQPLITILSAISIIFLQDKLIIPPFLAVSFLFIIISWFIAHIIDAGSWYNRNLVIISNIERQFLDEEDKKLIHCYIADHRKKNKLISHLKINAYLGWTLYILVCGYYIFWKLLPLISTYYCQKKIMLTIESLSDFLPLVILILSLYALYRFKTKEDDKYEEFKEKSPGKKIEGEKFKYGHGQK